MLQPLKIAATIGTMMSDPVGNLHCFTPLVTYIADTPEQSLLVGTSSNASPVSTVVYKEFGDPFPHPPRTAARTLEDIECACSEVSSHDFECFIKVSKCYSLNEIKQPAHSGNNQEYYAQIA